MEQKRFLCDICGKVIESRDPLKFSRETYLYTQEQVDDGVAVLPTVLHASVRIRRVGHDNEPSLDTCLECAMIVITKGQIV